MYESGFLTQHCDFAKNMSQLVTIVYDFMSLPGNLMSEQNVSTVVNQTLITYPGVKVKVARTVYSKCVAFQGMCFLNLSISIERRKLFIIHNGSREIQTFSSAGSVSRTPVLAPCCLLY